VKNAVVAARAADAKARSEGVAATARPNAEEIVDRAKSAGGGQGEGGAVGAEDAPREGEGGL